MKPKKIKAAIDGIMTGFNWENESALGSEYWVAVINELQAILTKKGVKQNVSE